jgi:hypothetical protein
VVSTGSVAPVTAATGAARSTAEADDPKAATTAAASGDDDRRAVQHHARGLATPAARVTRVAAPTAIAAWSKPVRSSAATAADGTLAGCVASALTHDHGKYVSRRHREGSRDLRADATVTTFERVSSPFGGEGLAALAV